MANNPDARGANALRQGAINVTAVIDHQLKSSRLNDTGAHERGKRIPVTDSKAEYEVKKGELVMVAKSSMARKVPGGQHQKYIMGVTSFGGARYSSRNPEDVLDECIPVGIAFRDAELKQQDGSRTRAWETFSVQVAGVFDVVNMTRALPVGSRLRWSLPNQNSGKFGMKINKQVLEPIPEMDGKPFAMRKKEKFESYAKGQISSDKMNRHELAFFDALTDIMMLGFAIATSVSTDPNANAAFQAIFPGSKPLAGVADGFRLFKRGLNNQADITQAENERRFLMRYLFPMMDQMNADKRFMLKAGQGNISASPAMMKIIHGLQRNAFGHLMETFADCVRADNAYMVGDVIVGGDSGELAVALL